MRKTVLTLLVVTALACALWLLRGRLAASGLLDKETVLAALERFRGNWWAPLAFVGLYAAACVLAVPATPLTLAGGAVFGTALGTLYNWTGALLGATGAFYVARLLGRGAVERIVGDRFKSFDAGVEREGFQVILTLRLVPLFPFNGINFGAGLSPIRPRDYVLATAAGILPGCFVYTYFADALLQGAAGGKAFWNLAVAGTLLAALSFIPRLLKKRAAKETGDG